MTTRRGRRESERRAKARRIRTAAAPESSFFDRVSPNWIVGGLIGLVVFIALFLFLVLSQIIGSSSDDRFDLGQVFSIAVTPANPETMFLGDVAGLFRSTNGGRSWNHYLIEDPIRSVYNDPNDPDVFYATGARILYKSTDGGLTWPAVESDLPDGNVSVLASDPADSSIMYAHVGLKGVYRSTDGGLSWSLRGRVPDAALTSLAVKPGSPETLFAFHTVEGFVLSTDGGRIFESLRVGLPTNAISDILTLRDEPDTMFAAAGSNIYKSTDSGRNWEVSNEGVTGIRIIALTQASGTGQLFAADFVGRVYTSTDSGASWVLNEAA